MRSQVAVVYNEPEPSRYTARGEDRAVHDILDAVDAVYLALLEDGHDAVKVPLLPPMDEAREKLKSLSADVVFNLFEGFCGFPETEVLVPEFCAGAGLPCTGCSASVLRLALDKDKAKDMLANAGIATPDYQVLSPKSMEAFRLSYPCIVKPRAEDASHGISTHSVVQDLASLTRQVALVSRSYGGAALVEQYIDGREFNATVMGSREQTVLPVSEIVYSLPAGMPHILTYSAKWEKHSLYYKGTRHICPAPVAEDKREELARTALAVFRLMVGSGYARVDMRTDVNGRIYVLEVNPNPDISPDAGAGRQAKTAGMSYAQFVERMLDIALERLDGIV